jgi:ribosome biogenesis GTPase
VEDVRRLISLFPEFEVEGSCKFADCIHINEPACRVKEAVERNEISRDRYEFFLRCYEKYKLERWN